MDDGTTLVERTENDSLIELARSAAAHTRTVDLVDHVLEVVLPPGHQHELIDLERFLPKPRRKAGRVELDTTGDLIDFIRRHRNGFGTGSAVVIYADQVRATFVAVLNDATANSPGWGDFRAILTLRPTAPWLHWASHNGALSGQIDFAEHIEAGLPEIVDPPAADMLELAQSFEAAQKVAFRTAHRLSDGRRALQYEETIDARAGEAGNIVIPREFRLALQPYEGSDVVEVVARLRYRIGSGSLTIGYQLVRPEDVLRAAFESSATLIAEEISDVPMFRGRPANR